jgi:hypothetical protein
VVDRSTIERARADIDVFARELVGEPLWDHQLAIARSPARIRCVCSGRQAGKSRTLALLALHAAFVRPEQRVLILSAGDDAAKDLLAEASALCQAPLLAGSVADASRSQITLSNGSTIRSVPASPRRVRGQAIDLLILDEACFIDEEIWTAARYTIIARPGSRVVMASTPWGAADRFFAVHYRAGTSGDEFTESFHWPSTVSPLVDQELLGMWQRTATDREYRREVLAEWVDDAGAYFTSAELTNALVDDELVPPAEAHGRHVVGGVDWGFSADANALVVVRATESYADGSQSYGVSWCEEHFNLPYSKFIDRVALTARPGAYRYAALMSEENGVGAMPSQELARRGLPVVPVYTTAALKEEAFATIKFLLQRDRLQLPVKAPALLGQLAALEFEERDAGSMRIAVPERAGHDDLATAFALAALGLGDVQPSHEEIVFFDPMSGGFSATEPRGVRIGPF